MHDSPRNFLKLLLLPALLLVLSGLATVSAIQQPPAKQKADAGDEPVAITKRTETAKPTDQPRNPGPNEFSNFRYPAINSKGDIAFIGLNTAPGTPQGYGQAIYLRSADGTWKATREGERLTNLNDEITGMNNVALNANGDLTFIATFAGKAPLPKVSTSVDVTQFVTRSQGLCFKTASGIKVIARLGEEVPNMPSFFSGIANASSNSKGTTAFVATYTDPDGRGLFIHDQGKLNLIARSGQRIGNNEEGTFSEHYYPSLINERGEIAWFSRVGTSGGIFVARPKGIEIIALQGKPAPIPDAKFIGFGQRAPAINDKGDVLFVAFYDGPNNGRGLFLKRESGQIEIVAKSGDALPGTTSNFTDFQNPLINARGDIAFLGHFGGRSRGIFLKTAKGIEPVVLVDEKLPGGKPHEIFNNFVQMSLGGSGEIVFYGQYRNGEVGIFVKDAKGLRPVALRGDKLPGTK
jgi:hypothetical protein